MSRLPWNFPVMDLARWRYADGEGWQPHCHDFYELFWVEHGHCRHRLDGQDELLGPGDLQLLDPDDDHVGTADDDAGVILVNLSVSREAVADLRQRYGGDFLLWDPASPRRQRLPSGAVQALSRLIAEINPLSAADRDLLLLRLSHALREQGGIDQQALPSWLREGLLAMEAEQAYAQGVSGLARRCGRSREHLNRTVQAVLGMTVTRMLQTVRIHAAARVLVVDEVPIVEVAMSTGFTSLAHFYKLFREICGETPLGFRRKRRGLGQAGPDPRALIHQG
jgi:AraC family cel operon transcriptional repressor